MWASQTVQHSLPRAGDVLPLLVDGPPAHRGPVIVGGNHVMPANWKGDVIFHQDKIAACPPDQRLTIDARELSGDLLQVS